MANRVDNLLYEVGVKITHQRVCRGPKGVAHLAHPATLDAQQMVAAVVNITTIVVPVIITTNVLTISITTATISTFNITTIITTITITFITTISFFII